MKFNFDSSRASRRSFTLGLMMAAMMFMAAVSANAQAPCTPSSSSPAADATVFEVEGKITAYDRTNRTITSNGMTLTVPSTLLIKTADLDATVGNITFEALTDPAAEASRSIIGGTVISTGNITSAAATTGACLTFVADSVYVEFAENVLSGALNSVNLSDNSFRVNGALVRMNQDARWPAQLLDAGGKEITLDKLFGYEGTLVSVEGYFDASLNTLFGVTVETEVITQQPGKDGVAITFAQGRTGDRELRVTGMNTRNSQNALASSVNIHAGGLNSTGTGCGGPQIGSAAVSQVDGSWSFRQRPAATIPTTVCAVSPLGGVAERAVEIRQ